MEAQPCRTDGSISPRLFTNLKTPERLEEIQNRTPLRGFAKEKDLGMAAAFLCSDAARFISGIDLVVDGGISSSFLL